MAVFLTLVPTHKYFSQLIFVMHWVLARSQLLLFDLWKTTNDAYEILRSTFTAQSQIRHSQHSHWFILRLSCQVLKIFHGVLFFASRLCLWLCHTFYVYWGNYSVSYFLIGCSRDLHCLFNFNVLCGIRYTIPQGLEASSPLVFVALLAGFSGLGSVSSAINSPARWTI